MSGARGINVLEQRMQRTQAKMLEARAQQYEQETELVKRNQEKWAQLNAMGLEKRTKKLRLSDGSFADMFIKGIDQNGNEQWERLDPEKRESPVQQLSQAIKVAEAMAEAEFPPVVDPETGKERRPAEFYRRRGELMGQLVGGRGGGQPVGVGGQATGKAAESADPKDWQSFDPHNEAAWTKGQRQWMGQQRAGIQAALTGAYTDESKKAVVDAIHQKIIVAADKSLPPAEKARRIAELGKVGTADLPAPPVQPVPPARLPSFRDPGVPFVGVS